MDAALIARAYAAFARYPKKVCPTVASWDAEIELRKRVKTTRLADLDCNDIEAVWWNATGDEASVKHFLPRVLQCVADGRMSLDDVEQRLRRLSVETWPDEERAVVRSILESTRLP